MNGLVRRASLPFLWLIPFLPFLTAAYEPGGLRRYLLAGALHGALIGVAAWSLARRRAVDDARERRVITIASSLLVANWATASLALNMNDPPVGAAWLETIPDQYFRYAALVAAALMTLAGFRVLEAPVREADQRTWSVLGFRAAVMSAVLFVLLFLPYPRVLTARFAHQATFGAAPDWWPMFRSAFSWVENVQRACSYAAVIFFAIGSKRAGMLGRVGVTCILALTVLLAALTTVAHVPPAVPFILPYLIGVALMQRARSVAILPRS